MPLIPAGRPTIGRFLYRLYSTAIAAVLLGLALHLSPAGAGDNCSCSDVTDGSSQPARRGSLRAASWAELPNLDTGAVSPVTWQALLLGCDALRGNPLWRESCDAAAALPALPDADTRLAFLQAHFQPWRAVGSEGQADGLATGYYEPILHGSRTPDARFRYPLYAPPEDLLTVDLGSVVPELRGRRVRARLDGKTVVPYFSRAQIDQQTPESLRGREIVWVDDPVELFFLHIQGSGRIELVEGGGMHVGYADQNGQPFRSVGRLLIDHGELTAAQATLQGIKAWARAHPERVPAYLNGDPSYVFFRELPGDLPGPLGSLGVPLLPEAAVAVDSRVVPLGAPVLVDTTFPLTQQPLRRIAMAQDTGGAINGAVRIDYYWGVGEDALAQAGRMRQKLRLWALLPIGTHPVQGALVADAAEGSLPAVPASAPSGPALVGGQPAAATPAPGSADGGTAVIQLKPAETLQSPPGSQSQSDAAASGAPARLPIPGQAAPVVTRGAADAATPPPTSMTMPTPMSTPTPQP